MLDATIDFAALFTASLLVGAVFCVWLSLNPAGLDAPTYIAQQQHSIRSVNTVMPILGAITLVLTLVAAFLARADVTRLSLLLVAAAGFLIAGLVTRFINQPMNAVVMTWSPATYPDNWTVLRDSWWSWHLVRVAVCFLALGGLIAAVLQRGVSS